MSKFYIKKLVASGKNKRDSVIEFSPYLTIISGASNTGKTYIFKCIKHIFGADKLEIEENIGYTSFKIIICIDNKEISFSREKNSDIIEVVSNYDAIESGIYFIDSDNSKNINMVYLKLFGINESFKVPYNKNCDMKEFSFEMFLHMLMIYEKDIERDLSIILPKEPSNKIYFLSHLLYLLYKTNFSDYDINNNDEIKQIKSEAITEFIKIQLDSLKERSEVLQNKIFPYNKHNIDYEIQKLSITLNFVEIKMNEEFINRQTLLEDISQKNERLNECNLLLNRYLSLESQFTSDIQRLTFIFESSSILSDISKEEKCPHCHQKIIKQTEFEINSETIKSEISRIVTQLNGLIKIKDELLNEINDIKTDLNILEMKKNEIDKSINVDLKTEKRNIEQKIKNLQEYISLSSELELIKSFNSQWNKDLDELHKKSSKKLFYKPLELFPSDFEDDLSEEIRLILKICGHPKPNRASFSLKNFDIELSNNSKATNGKGFTAFYNTIVLLAFRKYLYEKAYIKPPFYIIDSPLLGLDVGRSRINKNNLIEGVYNYFITSVDQSQLIIIDNTKDIPNVSFKNPKIKHYIFSNDDNENHGFLVDYDE